MLRGPCQKEPAALQQINNILKLLCYKNVSSVFIGDCYNQITKITGIQKRYLENDSKRIKEEEKEKLQNKDDYDLLTKRGQIEAFWKIQPFYYDKNKIFWLWDKEKFKWVMSDEVDFCNSIYETLGIDTIDSKTRSEIIESFKQVGRKHKPKDIEKSWVQFKHLVYDIKTGNIFDASPEFFITNPIPWKIGDSEDTPTIDKYLTDWVQGQDITWKNTLYDLLTNTIII